ncbi:unnamed protein product [Allacma fusca]|uniref:Uncharacterized protein n=1 Tax=Allacma fusca TaxID=39272 RepID=A0A8J2KHS6_9HEXA|nr:unnamed protein product [Allacma fusca]
MIESESGPLKKFLRNKLDRYRAFASVIDSISTVRWVKFRWNWKARECEEYSTFNSCLYYGQVVNHAIFLGVSIISYAWYFLQTDRINLGAAVSEVLIIIAIIYSSCYQISTLRFAKDAENHISQQDVLNRRFASIMSIPPSEHWCTGILYYFCLMCNMSRPCFGTFMYPYFLKEESPMNLYFRLGGQQFDPMHFLYALWSSYNIQIAYMITNYYAILCLGHAYFYTFWLRSLVKTMKAKPTEDILKRAAKIFQMLRVQNITCYHAYGRMILPSVIVCASAWVTMSIVCLLRLYNQMDPLSLFIIMTAASQAVCFLSLQFYSSHRMASDSMNFIEVFGKLKCSEPYWKSVVGSWSRLGFHVGGFYIISISDLQVWAEALINQTMLCLSLF